MSIVSDGGSPQAGGTERCPSSKRFVKTIKLRAYTTRRGYGQIDAALVDLARLYNAALEERKTAYKQAGVKLNRNHQSKELTAIRAADEAFGCVNRRIQVNVLERLDLAFAAFFRRAKAGEKPGYPRFKSRYRFKTLGSRFVEPSWYKRAGNEIQLKVNGLPVVRAPIGFRIIPEGKPLSMTITKKGRALWLSLVYEFHPDRRTPTGAVVGIDRGVTVQAADSNGVQYPRIRTNHRKRRRLQRRMDRRKPKPGKKGSHRYYRAKGDHARFLDRERRVAVGRLHEVTSEIVRNNDFISVEALRIVNMTRSAKGDVEKPGRNVRAKAGLNRSILEQRWGTMLNQLKYKAEWAGAKVVEVDPAFTSQTCSSCGVVSSANRRGKHYDCAACGIHMDADTNAAVNILRRGLLALGLEPRLTGAQDGQQLVCGQLRLFAESPG